MTGKYIFSLQGNFNLYAKLGFESWSSTDALSGSSDDSSFTVFNQAKNDSGIAPLFGAGINVKGFQIEIAPRTFKDEDGGYDWVSTLLQIGYAFSF